MSFIELFTPWSGQILLVGLGAEVCAPLLRDSHPRVRARFWLTALHLGLAAPWLLGRASATTGFSDEYGLTMVSTAVAGALRAISPSGEEIIVLLWGAVALARLVGLARGIHRLAAITSESRPIEVGGSPEFRIRESASIQSPAASFVGQVILVPANFRGLPDAWKRAALVHETIHMQRRHGLLLVAEEVILALLWFHPMVHRLIRRVRDSREEMVDAATVAVTGATRDYRDMLVGFAANIRIPAPAVSGTTAFGARIKSLAALEENPMPITSAPRLLTAGLALFCAAAFASAAAPLGLAGQEAAGNGKETKKAPRRVVSRVNPIYPQAMKDEKVEGVVAIEVTVGPDGRPTATRNRMLAREAHPELVKAAMEALQQWRWESGAGSIQMTHTIQFKLRTDEKK